MKREISPFVKWAGGKTQLLDRLSCRMPATYGCYYEPFIGGGALLLALQPSPAVINDINKQLIHTYKTIRDFPAELVSYITQLDSVPCTEEHYYKLRDRYNAKIMKSAYDIELAALFIFINKHCYNGLYRVNKRGLYNVPWNRNEQTKSASVDNLMALSAFLQNVTILNGDFEAAVATAGAGDFVFFDSPYAPLNPTSFESYTKEGFREEDHRRLARLFRDLDQRGCRCMLTNHNTPFIQELYSDFRIEEVDVKRAINADASKRQGKEVIIRNY